MKLRPLGRSGIEVSPLCFGGNVFGWTADEPTSHALLDRFVDAGFNFIDTANVYSFWIDGHRGGESETVIGNWLKKSGKRDRVVIATKVGMAMPELGAGLDRARIEKSVDDSVVCVGRLISHERVDFPGRGGQTGDRKTHAADEGAAIGGRRGLEPGGAQL